MILIIILILRGKGMLNMKSRFIVILMTVLLCLSVFGSVFCLAEHSHHKCTGENCAVCAILEQCTQRLRTVAAAAAVLFVVCVQTVATAVFGTCLVVLALLSGSSVAVQLLFSSK